MHVLVVDDSKTVRNIIISYITALGIRDISEADSGESALYIVIRKKVDFIFLDWNMPKMNGLEFLTKIRAVSNHSQIPVLMVTTENERDKVLQASSLGIEGFVIKPFSKEMLLHKLLDIFLKRGLKLPAPGSEPQAAAQAAEPEPPAAGETALEGANQASAAKPAA